MPRTATATVAPIARHQPYQPPLAHLVRITAAYTPACATDVRATIERVRQQLQAHQPKAARRAAAAAARCAGQRDLFNPRADATVVCIAAVQRLRAA